MKYSTGDINHLPEDNVTRALLSKIPTEIINISCEIINISNGMINIPLGILYNISNPEIIKILNISRGIIFFYSVGIVLDALIETNLKILKLNYRKSL